MIVIEGGANDLERTLGLPVDGSATVCAAWSVSASRVQERFSERDVLDREIDCPIDDEDALRPTTADCDLFAAVNDGIFGNLF